MIGVPHHVHVTGDNQVQLGEICGHFTCMGGKRNSFRILVGTPEGGTTLKA